ncbi:acyl-CoA dehydrogenase family protein [Subtercola lobariae]|uniref:Monooxygenase n=1 Tax=Subtercola lobariae TaxID=1588641 RepID=A0A917EYE1_9MICO|nr:acyl-CoA dehydrogenase family protein [Subtercola lobariae]GGF22347.1 monooxygenase [Subtercola lobariae]
MSSLDLLPDPSNVEPADHLRWYALAQGVADQLRADIVERDRANALPVAEVQLLRSSGLLTAGLPEAIGGGGLPWRTTSQLVRIIARSDASIAHILGYHYVWLRYIQTFETPQSEKALRDTVQNRWLWASPGSNRAVGYPKTTATDGGHVVHGDSGFATGAPVADRLFSITIDSETNEMVVVIVDPQSPSVSFTGEWDVLGQRLSASQSITLDQLAITDAEILKRFGDVTLGQTPRQSVGVLHFQLTFGILHLAIAEGALLEAADYTRNHTRPALHSTVSNGHDEPFILNAYGDYLANVQAVSALVERGVNALEWLYALGDDATAEQRAAVAEIIASAKVTSTDVALAVSSGLFELTGARSTATNLAFDRFWRNVRTLSLHDPVAYKRDELGRYFINGEAPIPSGYR